jgi:hypothetical protein
MLQYAVTMMLITQSKLVPLRITQPTLEYTLLMDFYDMIEVTLSLYFL